MKLIFFLLAISCHQGHPFILSVITTIYDAYTIAKDASDTFASFTSPSTQDLMDEIVSLKNDVNKFTKEVSNKIDTLYQQLITQLPKLGQINRGMERFAQLYNRISFLYKHFEKVVRPATKNPNVRSLKEFSDAALGLSSDSIKAVMDSLHELFIPTEIGHLNQGLLASLASNLGNSITTGESCTYGNSPQEELYLLYTALLSAEIRAFMMTSLTYILLESLSEVSYEDDLRNTKADTLARIQEYMWEIRDITNWTSREFYDCSAPGGDRGGSTVFELERVASPLILNEGSLGIDCADACNTENKPLSTEVIDCDIEDELCAVNEECTGELQNCFNIPDGTACLNPDKNVGTRRYLYLQKGDDRYGNESQCTDGTQFKFHQYTAHSEKKGGDAVCNYCFCICIENSRKWSYVFSLRPQLADYKNNKAVAAIKFTKSSNIIHLQIQEGKIQADGIAAETLTWMPLETMTIDEKSGNGSPLSVLDETQKKLEEGKDFLQLTFNRRQFNLDNLVAPDGYVVTGARLSPPSDDQTILQLEIHATPFNFTTSKLIISDDKPSIWIGPDKMKGVLPAYDKSRAEQQPAFDVDSKLVTYDVPTVKTSQPNTYVKLQLSNLHDDVEGTVWPLLDLRPLNPSTPVLLEGIGMIFKQLVGSPEGYLAFSLRAVNRRHFLDHEVTAEDIE